MPPVSIIIPTFNRAHCLRIAIESVLSQTYNNYEILIIDDGSTDNTKEVLQSYLSKVHYFYQENKGVSAARNTGIKMASGEWVAFLDSDDFWLPNKLEAQVADVDSVASEVVLHTTDANITRPKFGNCRSQFEVTGISRLINFQSFYLLDNPLPYVLKHWFLSCQSTIMRKASLLKAGMFDETLNLHEDYDLFCRMALEGSWILSPQRLVEIRRLDGANLSDHGASMNNLSLTNQIKVCSKLHDLVKQNASQLKLIRARQAALLSNLAIKIHRDNCTSRAKNLIYDALKMNFTLKILAKFLIIHFNFKFNVT